MVSGKVPELLQQRRISTNKRIAALRQWLTAAGAEALIRNAACIYATGSVGRGEASAHSDLDVFVVATGESKRLDGIRLLAKLIDATEALKFPPPSRDGEYLQIHKVEELIRHLGTREDDHTNVFTARLLLLLESRAILGTTVYQSALRQVIDFTGATSRTIRKTSGQPSSPMTSRGFGKASASRMKPLDHRIRMRRKPNGG